MPTGNACNLFMLKLQIIIFPTTFMTINLLIIEFFSPISVQIHSYDLINANFGVL